MSLHRIVIPTKVYFGRNIWKEAIKEQESLLQGNILVVTTGRSLLRLGYIDELVSQLRLCTHVKNIVIFDKVSANPKLSEVREGILLGRQEQVDMVIGFGGGSAMDAAKAVAVGVRLREDIEFYFYQGKEPGESTLPVIEIPTTAGTGSELSKAAILTDEARKVKNGIRGKALYPLVAIVDSCFTETVPFRVTMETGFDVLAHAAESYLSKAASPYTRMLSETAIKITGKYLPRLAGQLSDREAREKMSYASMLMGINLGHASTCFPHRLQYPLGAHTDTSHGLGLAALFTAWIRCEHKYVPDQVEEILELLIGEKKRGENACAEAMHGFISSLQLPTSLREMGIAKGQLPILVSGVSGNIENDPASCMEGIVTMLYEMAWEGE